MTNCRKVKRTQILSRGGDSSWTRIMSLLGILLGGLLVFNAALFAAIWFRRPNPKLRAKLFNWVVRGDAQRPLPSSSLPLRAKATPTSTRDHLRANKPRAPPRI